MESEAEKGSGQLQENGKNNEAVQSKILAMRQVVEHHDPSAKEVDDPTLKRFLRARDLDVEKATAMFLKYLDWRKAFVPRGVVSPAEVKNEIAQNKMFLQGFDKKGQPIAVLFGSKHIKIKGGLEEFKRFAVYTLDKICERLPLGQEKFVVIADVEGWGYANCDIRAYLGALSILQIAFIDNKKLKSTLLEDIEENQIPEIYGGKLPLIPIQGSLTD